MKKKLEIGKGYTWKEVQEAYPNKWVRMNDCTFGWGNSIVDGVLTGVYNDGETEDVRIEVWEGRNNKTKNDRLRRTSIGMGVGVIDCLNAKMEVRDEP